jgi:hypothetical protein
LGAPTYVRHDQGTLLGRTALVGKHDLTLIKAFAKLRGKLHERKLSIGAASSKRDLKLKLFSQCPLFSHASNSAREQGFEGLVVPRLGHRSRSEQRAHLKLTPHEAEE